MIYEDHEELPLTSLVQTIVLNCVYASSSSKGVEKRTTELDL